MKDLKIYKIGLKLYKDFDMFVFINKILKNIKIIEIEEDLFIVKHLKGLYSLNFYREKNNSYTITVKTRHKTISKNILKLITYLILKNKEDLNLAS